MNNKQQNSNYPAMSSLAKDICMALKNIPRIDHTSSSVHRFLSAADLAFYSFRHSPTINPIIERIFVAQLMNKIPRATANFMPSAQMNYAEFKRELLRSSYIQETFTTRTRSSHFASANTEAESFAERVAKIVVEKLRIYFTSYSTRNFNYRNFYDRNNNRNFNNRRFDGRRPWYDGRQSNQSNQARFTRRFI